MVIPTLDKQTKELSNSVSEEELRKLQILSTPYGHEIIWYGIEAVAHTYLMQMAKGISEGKISLEEFIQKYKLNFENTTGSTAPGFHGLLKAVEKDGIFIPEHAYWFFSPVDNISERTINYFSGDYGNRIRRDAWVNKSYAHKLAFKLVWQPSDLENSKIAELGIKFGKDMWKTCVEGFERQTQERKQPENLTNSGRRLIKYYTKVIDAPNL